MSAAKSKLPDLPESFVRAHVALDQLVNKHHEVLSEGRIIRRRLRQAAQVIESVAAMDELINEQRQLQDFVAYIGKAAALAKDQAEQEQRIVEESPAMGGQPEHNAERYFALNTELTKLANEFRPPKSNI